MRLRTSPISRPKKGHPMTEQTAADFYGKTYTPERAEKLDSAFKTLNTALRTTGNASLQQRALDLAAKKELEAFA
jgi:hypothetical protein